MSPQTNTTRNYYDALGISDTATASQIQNAVREKLHALETVKAQAAKLDPEGARTFRANLEQKAKEIAEAYDVLSDVRKRKSYDNSLQRSKTPSAEEELPVPTKVRKVRFLVWGITSGIIVIVSIYSGFPPEVPHRVWELLLVAFIIILQIKIVGPPYGPVDDGDATHNVNVALRALLFFGILLYVVIRLKLQLAHLK